MAARVAVPVFIWAFLDAARVGAAGKTLEVANVRIPAGTFIVERLLLIGTRNVQLLAIHVHALSCGPIEYLRIAGLNTFSILQILVNRALAAVR